MLRRAHSTNKCVIKCEIKFSDYKTCLKKNKTILKSWQSFKCEAHNVFTEKFNKIELSENDDKELQKRHWVNSYPYAGKVCKAELIEYMKMKH